MIWEIFIVLEKLYKRCDVETIPRPFLKDWSLDQYPEVLPKYTQIKVLTTYFYFI